MGLVGLSCAAADVGSGFWNNHASDSGRLGKRACEIVWLTTFGVALMCNIKITDMRGYMVVFNGSLRRSVLQSHSRAQETGSRLT
jgi:hypothetical protein